MSNSQDIFPLFATLASNLKSLNSPDQNLDLSNLSRSLNLRDSPAIRPPVLDKALSLMCFTAPQVFDSMVECTVKTIVSVLSSSVECRVDKEGFIRMGGLITGDDCVQVIRVCADILGKLNGHKGRLSALLLYNVVRGAVMAPSLLGCFQSNFFHDPSGSTSSTSALVKLLCHFQKGLNIKDDEEMPLRLLLWFLNPMILKQDISHILEEIIRRPFLCLNMDLYERLEWRSIMICLVLSPLMFIHTRALLHNWFRATGLASVLELQMGIVSQILDIVSRPTRWGISREVGSKLPFSDSYFPHGHQFLTILAGPVCKQNFQRLVHEINGSVYHAEQCRGTSSKRNSTKMATVDHKSMWSVAINFPEWFLFASILLFTSESSDGHCPKCIYKASETSASNDVEVSLSAGAAKFIGWILIPISKSHQDLLVDYLTKLSESWILEHSIANKHVEARTGYKKEARKRGLHATSGTTSYRMDSSTIWLWLKEFHETYTNYSERLNDIIISSKTHAAKGFRTRQDLLFRRIPLAILIGYSNHLNDAGSELLLHYASTGNIPQFGETEISESKQRRFKFECPVTWTEMYTRKDAIAGSRMVFDIADITEKISFYISDTEEHASNFLLEVKLQTRSYLLKCIKRLLQLKLDEDVRNIICRDLWNRLLRWRHQGKDVFENCKEVDQVFDALNCIQLQDSQ